MSSAICLLTEFTLLRTLSNALRTPDFYVFEYLSTDLSLSVLDNGDPL